RRGPEGSGPGSVLQNNCEQVCSHTDRVQEHLPATVALAPVFHPWYATWPLALLAVAARRTTWFVVPAAVATFLALPDGTNLARLTKAPGAVAMTALVIAVAVWGLPRLRRATVDAH
ncbi:hypothetical protein AB0I76_24430, partial [Micromonospora sp. NPDC049799]